MIIDPDSIKKRTAPQAQEQRQQGGGRQGPGPAVVVETQQQQLPQLRRPSQQLHRGTYARTGVCTGYQDPNDQAPME